MKSFLILLVIIFAAQCASGQNTRRPRLVAEPPATQIADALSADTVVAPVDIVITGFDKPLRSAKETFFIVNHSARELLGVFLSVVYSDMAGRSLLRRSEFVGCTLSPGETGYFSLPSWDKQKAFYYHRNPPYRPRTSATPFDVAVTVDSVLFTPLPHPSPLT